MEPPEREPRTTKKTRRTIGPYRILKKLEAGGMGVVFKALREGTNSVVALKALPPKMAADLERLARFRREVIACSRLDHPNLIRVLDHGVDKDIHFFTMEYFPGLSLKALLKRQGSLPPDRTLAIMRQVCAACVFYHAKSLVHRDIKPGNVLIDRSGRVKVIDFGLAKVRDLSSMTRLDQAIGTVRYLAPEVLLGRPIDRRADIYQLGLVIHEMLTGEALFAGPEPMVAVRAYVFNGRPLARANFKVTDQNWCRLLFNCLARDAADRYQDASELGQDLERVGRGETVELLWRVRAGLADRAPGGAELVESPSKPELPAVQPPPAPATAPAPTPAPPPAAVAAEALLAQPPAATSGRVREKTLRQRVALAPPPRHRPSLLYLGVLALLGVLSWLLLGTRNVTIYEPAVALGVDRAVVRWESSQETPTVLEYAKMDGPEFTRAEGSGVGLTHEVTLTGLEPGKRYRYHAVLPDGRLSRQFVFETRLPKVRDLRLARALSGRVTARFSTDVPLLCEVAYLTAAGPASVPTGSAATQAHEVELPNYAPTVNAVLKIRFRTSEDRPAHDLDVPAPQP